MPEWGNFEIKGWFAIDNNIPLFVLEEFSDNLLNSNVWDPISKTNIPITDSKVQITFDLFSGRAVRKIETSTTKDGRVIIGENPFYCLDFYDADALPIEYESVLMELEKQK